MRIKVDFWTSSYAPCMVQARIVREDLLDVCRAQYESVGQEWEEDSALIAYEEAEYMLTPRAYRDLTEGWSVRALVDPFEAGNLYGYDCNEAVSAAA